MILTGKILQRFWLWYEHLDTVRKYNQIDKEEYWVDIQVCDNKKFNSVKYRTDFVFKSQVEKNAIFIDFFESVNMIIDSQPSPYYGDGPIELEDIPERQPEKIVWFMNIFIFPFIDIDVIPEEFYDTEKYYFDSRMESNIEALKIANEYFNTKTIE